MSKRDASEIESRCCALKAASTLVGIQRTQPGKGKKNLAKLNNMQRFTVVLQQPFYHRGQFFFIQSTEPHVKANIVTLISLRTNMCSTSRIKKYATTQDFGKEIGQGVKRTVYSESLLSVHNKSGIVSLQMG